MMPIAVLNGGAMKKISYLGCLLISAALLLAFVPVATAATYYVSNSGNDTPDCTQTGPWKTILQVQNCLSRLQPGDSVLFERGGIWYEELDLDNVNGNSGSRIIFSNYGSGPLPVIDGGSSRDYCIKAINTSVSYLVIDGFECRNTKQQAIVF